MADMAVKDLIEQFKSSDSQRVLEAGQQLSDRGADVLEPLLEAVGDTEMLSRYRQIEPMSDYEAGLLILELTKRRMEKVE